MRLMFCVATLAMAGVAGSTAAQTSLSADVQISTDERRRGLSWSDGDIAPSAQIGVQSGAFDASARLTATRGSARHAGADSAADVEAGYRLIDTGGLSLTARGALHLFTGAGRDMTYGEVGGDLGYLLGPAQVTAGVRYAPDQGSIGGDNLYLFGEASAGIPTTPFSLRAGVGRSSGRTDNAILASRLRPENGRSYTDWWLGVSHTTGPFSIGVTYGGTDVDRARVTSPYGDARHSGDRLVGKVGISF